MNKKGLSMAEKNNALSGTRFLVIAAALVIILYGINQAQSVVVLLLVSFFLSVIGTVPVLWMERKGVPTLPAVLLVVAAMVVLLLGLGAVVGASLNSFTNALPFYQARMHEMILEIRALFAKRGLSVTDKVLLSYVNSEAIMNFIGSLFTELSSLLSSTLLILLTVMFILLEASSFPVKLRSVTDQPKAVFPQVTRFVIDIKRYMVITTLLNLIGGVLITIWLSILGVDFPVMWGFLAFLLHFIPNVGSIIAAVPAVLLALVQLGGGSAALAAGGYLVIGTVVGNVIAPRVMGHRLGLSTLVVFLSLIFWGNLLGVVGALLCVPLTMTLKLGCEANESTRWIAVLLGPELPSEVSPAVSKKKDNR
jgi:predicted PurR-regulated permease PerM